MNISITRDSVAMGDDIDAPHFQTISLPENATILEIVNALNNADYLASIHGGKATWSIVSNNPIAVIAQQWAKPKILPQFAHTLDSLFHDDDGYKLHINYHAQIDPDIVYDVLRKFKNPE